MSRLYYYKPTTGQYNPVKLFFLLILIIPVWLISFIYAGSLFWNPLTFLNPIITFFYAIAIGATVQLGMEFADNRNKSVAKYGGLLFAFIALYFSWANFLGIWTPNDLPFTMLDPLVMWEFITQLFHEGAHTTFGFSVSGIFGVIVWIAEALIILVFSSTMVDVEDANRFYCNHCSKWIEPIHNFYQFLFPDKSQLLERYKARDFTFLEETEEADPKKDDHYFSISTAACNTCSRTYLLNLSEVERIRVEDKDSKPESKISVLEPWAHFTFPQFKLLYARSRHWFKYTESGKFSHTLWLSLPIAAVVIFILALFYQLVTINFENYFVSFVSFILFGVLISYMTKWILQGFAVRNKTVASFFGLLFGSMTMYICYAAMTWIYMPDQFSLHPDSIWHVIRLHQEQYMLSWLGYTGTIFEAAGFILIPVFSSTSLSEERVYCEKCKRWADQEDEYLRFEYDNQEELKRKFTRNDLSFLEDAQMLQGTEHNSDHYRIRAEWCDTCKTVHTLSLDQVTVKYDSEYDKYTDSFNTLYEDVIFTKESFDEVSSLRTSARG